jgi:hypothetical protein
MEQPRCSSWTLQRAVGNLGDESAVRLAQFNAMCSFPSPNASLAKGRVTMAAGNGDAEGGDSSPEPPLHFI